MFVYRFFILLSCLSLTVSVQAEVFDLFNQDRGKPPESTEVKPKPTPVVKQKPKPKPKVAKKPKALKPQQDFMLKGISYLGRKHRVILKLPDGKERLVTWKPKQKRPIPGFAAYKITDVNVDDREVKIAYPKIAPCRKNNESKGVSCESETEAKVAFVYGKPSAMPVAAKRPAGNTKNKTNNNTQAKGGTDLAKRFEKQLIGDSDIPEGMRRVRTPFGDRLVPKKP